MENNQIYVHIVINWSHYDFKWTVNPQIIKVLATIINTKEANLHYKKANKLEINLYDLNQYDKYSKCPDAYNSYFTDITIYGNLQEGEVCAMYNNDNMENVNYPFCISEEILKEFCEKIYQKEMMKLFGLDVNEIKII